MKQEETTDLSFIKESLILYKLVILYMLEQMKEPLSNSQITECIVSRDIASYFTVQQTIAQLLESRLIASKKNRNRTFFTNTEEGRRTLNYYRYLAPERILSSIDDYLRENKLEIKQQICIFADYEPLPEKEYAVYFSIKEQDASIFQLTLTVPDEKLAVKMCDNWQKKNEELYADIMSKLMN